MIGNDRFVQVFGSVPAGDTTRLTQIVTNAVREGFHIVLCVPGGDTPVCTLPVTHQKREHECGTAHVLSLESLITRNHDDPWYLDQWINLDNGDPKNGEYSPKDLAKVRAKVQAIINRVTKQQGGPPNIAVQPGPSGYAVLDNAVDVTVIEDNGPFVHFFSWAWYTIPKTADPTGVSILVPPSVIGGRPLRIIGQTNPAPAWLLDRITQTT